MHASAFLHDIPKPIWIAAMVMGFIWFWPVGLAILALEFAFARRWLQYLKARAASITHRSPSPK